jgi:glycosyltransferase involved in cell wall biosynthesis
MEGWMKVSIIMPVYNERATIDEIVRRVLAVPVDLELLIVNDASTDGTDEALARMSDPRLRIFTHARNQGKGAAIRTAIPEAVGDAIVIQDGDLEYDPAQIPSLLEPIERGVADVVYGSRFLGGPHRAHLFWHHVANRFLTGLSNLLNDLNLTDMETCYKCFRREMLQGLRLRSDRFGFEPEVTAKLARRRARFYEVPISYFGRDYSEGKKIRWTDGVAAVAAVVRYRFFD